MTSPRTPLSGPGAGQRFQSCAGKKASVRHEVAQLQQEDADHGDHEGVIDPRPADVDERIAVVEDQHALAPT